MELRKASPVVMIAQTIRASLLANATATTLAGLRALSAASQPHNAPLRFGAARKTEMAPSQAAKSRPDFGADRGATARNRRCLGKTTVP
jgi:hypothetical protein